MSLKPLKLRSVIDEGRNELQLTRESFITKVTNLVTSYFCYSTELRFLLHFNDMDDEEYTKSRKTAEYWHSKSLEILYAFLPADCHLFGHISGSYQKNFAPSK